MKTTEQAAYQPTSRYGFDVGYLTVVEGWDAASARATVLFSDLLGRYLRRRCQLMGHRWVDDSYGGPNGGCMAGHCRRCGDSFYTTLY